ncbi:hypothetical protein O181_097469 [Austropuccinia psidii MF-1]|uniref:Uncharacterized protein n=1 Tax=Austropuccinia psidii MF-1 TaxID=1389203 RepID=A0A9Q3J9B8_9BASI|nr:hypothetical protein [Austropuccinia psidii MF-1]
MSSHTVGFTADFFNAFCPFTTKELEDLVLDIPPTNRLRRLVWEWLTANGPYPSIPSSPPALGDLLSSPTGSVSLHLQQLWPFIPSLMESLIQGSWILKQPHLFIPKELQIGPTFFALVIV